jgi:hypothetical protein
MSRVLFVGQKPETVDFSDPALPPGFNAEKITAGIAIAVAKIGERGWQGDTCMITPDEAGRAMLEKALKQAAYDCVVIGGGLRIPPKSLTLFEMVVNAVHKAAPGAKIAFNTRPEDTAESCSPPAQWRLMARSGRWPGYFYFKPWLATVSFAAEI